jgi:RHS repeat-associated protein
LTTEAFGNPVAQWGSSANPYRFAGAWGYRDDGDAGLFYVGARYYEPAVGRWTSADKWLGDLYRPLFLNRYLYCEDDPVNHVDPSGHASLADWLLATGTVVAGIGGAVTYVNPVVGGAVAVVGTVVAAIGGGIQMGEYLGEALFPLPTKEPAPSPEDLDDYRRQLEEGWRSGEIPKPHHPRYHPVPIIRALDPPVYRAR